jgi:hypothetical protein
VSCLNNPTCAAAMGCFQGCVLANNPPATCQSMCCSGPDCNAWTSCVTSNCAPLCF